MSELKDCPFCASTNIYPFISGDDEDTRENVQWISCPECDAIGPSNTGDKPIGDGDVFKAWNTRTYGWISVEDRLPEDQETVIIRGGCGYYCHDDEVWYSAISKNHLGVDAEIQWPVTHWMPLPEPPK